MTRIDDAPERLARMRALTDAALAGEATGAPAFDALGVVAAEAYIPPALAHALLGGFALDAAGWQPESEGDLYRYCWHVAGAVGVMMALVMGVDPADDDTLDRACDLGLAFQLANIARDVAEDAAVGRCYLPAVWLADEGIPSGAQMAPEHRAGLVRIVRRLTDRAALHEASARIGARALPFRSAWAVLAAAGIYGDIGRKVARRGARAWDDRTTTSRGEKLGWTIRAAAGAGMRRRLRFVARPPLLWTRPRG